MNTEPLHTPSLNDHPSTMDPTDAASPDTGSSTTRLWYDVTRSYDDNYAYGPFGAFGDALARREDTGKEGVQDAGREEADPGRTYTYEFFGIPVRMPFGIPAGPLLNARFTTAAFRMGFDLAVYKTVRSRAWPCNPFPNVLAVHPGSGDGSLMPGSAELEEGVLADDRYEQPISISNSFGVPSRDPDQWQPDMKAAIEAAGPGQLLIPSFQGSRVAGMDTNAYIEDHAHAAHLICQTGARLMEMNTSCPNEGGNRLLCDDPHLVGRITEAVKNDIGDRPLIIKLAYIPSDEALKTMIMETAALGRVQGFTAINTISAKLVDAEGGQALPGEGRGRSGVCGRAIRPAGLDMVRRLAALRERLGLDFRIIGVGGVTEPVDYASYRAAGADAVMSATGAMWHPDLAHRIAREVHGR